MNTAQIVFPQATNTYLSTNRAPYNAVGTNPTTNASDRVYSEETNALNQLSLAGNYTAGFTASLTVGLPTTAIP